MMRRKGWRLSTALAACALACALPARGADVPMVGMDDDGNVTELRMNGKDYTEQLSAVLTAMHDSAEEALRSRAARAGWSLRTFVLGVGVGFEMGLGPVIKLKVSPKFRLAFANNADPALP